MNTIKDNNNINKYNNGLIIEQSKHNNKINE